MDETSVEIIGAFKSVESAIDSQSHNRKDCSLESNEVLAILRPGLEYLSFDVEISEGKSKMHTIPVPVLFGLNGNPEKSFLADAYSPEKRYVIEVESGQGYTNHKFLKDFFESCMMLDVDYACIAIRNVYCNNRRDFENVCKFFDAMYASGRLGIPLSGLLIIGY